MKGFNLHLLIHDGLEYPVRAFVEIEASVSHLWLCGKVAAVKAGNGLDDVVRWSTPRNAPVAGGAGGPEPPCLYTHRPITSLAFLVPEAVLQPLLKDGADVLLHPDQHS